MNFKKYHVSRNLFDKSNTDLIFPGTSLAIINEWNGNAGVGKVIRIPCEPLTIYTISGESDSTIFRISLSELETTPDPDVGSVECIDVLKASSVSTQTFTTTANTKYILVQVSATAFDDYINVLMLNTGSTALPYEPYSSEVWNDSHYTRVNGAWQPVASAHERSSGAWTE